MACIFNAISLDLTAGMTDSFEGRGAYPRGGGLIGGFTVDRYGILPYPHVKPVQNL